MRAIDTRHLDRDKVICCWEVGGVLVDPGPQSTEETLLAGLDGLEPRAVLLTHIHFDHAGASGALVRRWPELPVYVHEVGAPHMAAPERLVASAARLYGGEEGLARLWGDVVPVPERNLRVLYGGETVLGDFRVEYTPGHASHHVSYLHEPSGMAFTGDAAGVRVGDGPVMAPTPPPDVDLEAWRTSLELIEGWAPSAVAPTHFGRHEDVGAHLAGLRAYLDEWAPRARELDRDAWIAAWREYVAPASEIPAIEQAMPPDQQWMGLDRYWSGRE